MWTPENRSLYNRDKLRYPSDLTEAEWRHIGPLIPAATPGGRDQRADVPPFRLRQVARIAQLVTVVQRAVFGCPHLAPHESAPHKESQDRRRLQVLFSTVRQSTQM